MSIETQPTKVNIIFLCPECKSRESILIPRKIVEESKKLTTVSIPSGLMCSHSFQAFVDKHFKVRGYQPVDFEVSNLEYIDDELEIFSTKDIFNKVKSILRENLRINNIIGTGIFTVNGRVLFASLPYDILIQMKQPFEVKDEKKTLMVEEMYFRLENGYKIFLNRIIIRQNSIIIIVVFNHESLTGMGNLIVNKLMVKIREICKS